MFQKKGSIYFSQLNNSKEINSIYKIQSTIVLRDNETQKFKQYLKRVTTHELP